MKNRSKINDHLMWLAMANLLLFIVGSFIFYDLSTNIIPEIEGLDQKINSLQEMKRSANAVKSSIKGNKVLIDRLNLYFITKETTTSFIEELETAAVRLGATIKLNSLSLGREDKIPNKPSYLRLDLRVDGSFSHIFQYLMVLERLPYKIRFNSVNLAKVENASGISAVKVAGGVLWYADINMDLVSYIDK